MEAYSNTELSEELKEYFSSAKKVSCIESYNDAVHLSIDLAEKTTEIARCFFLDNARGVIKTHEFAGTVNRCVVFPAEVAKIALFCDACAVIIVHNHPGGSIDPSPSDWKLTETLFNSLLLFDISLLDHIIITRKDSVSMRELPQWIFKK
jgi:DNA repair protein RadC